MIFFDLDDTVVDDHTAVVNAARVLHDMKPAEPSASYEAFLARWWKLCDTTFDRYSRGEITAVDRLRERMRALWPGLGDAEADRRYAVYQEATAAGWKPFPDVLPALDALAGHRFGIITNGEEGQQRRKLTVTGLLPRFAVLVISGNVGAPKPDPVIFREACRLAGESPSTCAHVGDNLEKDARGATAAALRGIWLARSPALAPVRDVPTIRSLAELPGLLAQ